MLDRFRDRFLLALSTRIVRLDELVRTISTKEGVEALALAFHNLSGLGGTYGYPEVSEIASAAEESAWLLLEQGGGPDARTLELFGVAVTQLRNTAEQAQVARSSL